jgi:hypothetical protein
MRERLAAMLGEEAGKQLFAGTFHRQAGWLFRPVSWVAAVPPCIQAAHSTA